MSYKKQNQVEDSQVNLEAIIQGINNEFDSFKIDLKFKDQSTISPFMAIYKEVKELLNTVPLSQISDRLMEMFESTFNPADSSMDWEARYASDTLFTIRMIIKSMAEIQDWIHLIDRKILSNSLN